MKKIRKVASYSRVSTDEQAKTGGSLDDQQDKIQKECERNDNNLVINIIDDHSAKTFERPGFKKLLQFIKNNPGAVDLILVLKWSRFSRNTTDAYNMIRELKKLGVEVNSVEEPIDHNNPQAKIMLGIYLTIPEVDNDIRSKNVYDGMRRANLSGRYVGPAMKGYRNTKNENKISIIVPDENAPIIFQAFQMFSENIYSQKEVLTFIRSKGLKCSKTQLSIILKNRHYTGKVYVKPSETELAQWIDGIHEAIISEQLFNKVQDVLNGRNKKKNVLKVASAKDELQLRGFLQCTGCGNSLTGSQSKGNGGGYYYYHCNDCQLRYRADKLNSMMFAMLGDIQVESEVKELYWEVIKDLLKGSDLERKQEIKKRDTEIEQQQLRINNLIDKIADDDKEHPEYIHAIKRYETTITKLISERTEISMIRTEFDEYLKWGFNLLENVQGYYLNSPVDVKQKIIGSIYTGKLTFSEDKLRTNGVNKLVELICVPINQLHEKKTGQPPQNDKLSRLVPGAGIEPARP